MRITLAILGLAFVPQTLHADDWPQWLGPKRDGVWRETGIIDKFPADGPKKLWNVSVGLGYSGPAVVSGKLFLTDMMPADNQKIPASGFARGAVVRGNERVLCLDEKSGKELWKVEYPVEYRQLGYAAGPRVTPTVDGDHVYTLGAMGNFLCVNIETGKTVWSKDFRKDYNAPLPVWGFAAAPLIDGDKLICLVGGSDSRLVVAFDKKTGKEVWASASCGGDFGYCAPMIYEFGGKRQLVIWHTRRVVGLEPDSGKRIWSIDWNIRSALTAPTPMRVGEDKLFLTSFYNGSSLLKVTANSAEVVWKSKARGEGANQTTDLSSIMPTPMIDGEHVYGVCSYGQLRCLKAVTGERVWETMKATRGGLTPPSIRESGPGNRRERWSNAFLVRHDDRYFLFNEQGDLIIAKLTPEGYEEISRAHIIEPTNRMAGRMVVWTHPAFANQRVYVRNDKELACFDLAK